MLSLVNILRKRGAQFGTNVPFVNDVYSDVSKSKFSE